MSCGFLQVVTNAVYFKGKWQYPFPPYKTGTENFTALSKDSMTTSTPTLNVQASAAALNHTI
jgi:serine protease inhibitor